MQSVKFRIKEKNPLQGYEKRNKASLRTMEEYEMASYGPSKEQQLSVQQSLQTQNNIVPLMNVYQKPTQQQNPQPISQGPPTAINNGNLRSNLGDFLDYLIAYDGDNISYNRIIKTLESIIKTIEQTLASDRNSYTDIKSNIDILKEQMIETNGYKEMQQIIDQRLVYLDSILR